MKFTSISRKGGRENNTDSVGKASAGGIYCFVVADGLDEPNDNNVVSSTAVDAVLDAFGANPVISSEAIYSYMLCAQNAAQLSRSTDGQKNVRRNILIQRFCNLADLINVIVIRIVHFTVIAGERSLKNVDTVRIFVDDRGNLQNMIFNSI